MMMMVMVVMMTMTFTRTPSRISQSPLSIQWIDDYDDDDGNDGDGDDYDGDAEREPIKLQWCEEKHFDGMLATSS